MWQDTINGIFELGGGIFIFLHCIKLYRQKMVRGVSVPAVAIFVLWGFWNLYYYPHLGQWWSFAGGVTTVVANSTWVCMMVYYIVGEQRRNKLEISRHER
jgi:uncharacterized membrane protein YfcA